MDFLKAEIERKRKQREELEKKVKDVPTTTQSNNSASPAQVQVPGPNNPQNSTSPTGSPEFAPKSPGSDHDSQSSKKRKYITKGEIEKIREQEYLQKMEEERKAREAKLQELQQTEDKQSNKSEDSEFSGIDEQHPIFSLPIEDVFKRLRAKGEPITFFGESHKHRCLRLLRLEERRAEQSEGRNEFRDALKEAEAEQDSELAKKSADMEYFVVKKTPETQEEHIMQFLGDLLCLWYKELQERTEIQRRSAAGKLDTATFKQTKKYLKPLFRLLKKKELADDILVPLYEISQNCKGREYVKAHDIYLKMAIGNAPWPMGVTNVGIHERSAREKLHANQIAHVLNDETQRKYIQSVKRLMTYCQKLYPPAELSQVVG